MREKNGWGLVTMLVFIFILFIFLIVAAYYVYRFYTMIGA